MSDREVEAAKRTLIRHGQALPHSEEEWKVAHLSAILLGAEMHWLANNPDNEGSQGRINVVRNHVKWAIKLLEITREELG